MKLCVKNTHKQKTQTLTNLGFKIYNLINYSLEPKIWKAQYNKDAKAPKAATT